MMPPVSSSLDATFSGLPPPAYDFNLFSYMSSNLPKKKVDICAVMQLALV